MVHLKLYSFSKKRNSTKVPSSSAGTSYTGVIVEPTSVLDPIVKLEGITAYNYNYVYIQEFSRYYFINDWHTENGFWFINLTIDVLASHRSVIRSSTQYIERSASNVNEYIVDTLFPSSGNITKSVVEVNAGLQSFIQNGMFVLNITGSTDTAIGPWACTWNTFKNFVSEMTLKYDDDTFFGNIADGIRNSIWKPFEHLGSVIWFPDDYIDTTGITASTSITLGNIVISSSASKPMSFYHLTLPSLWTSATFNIPKHPQAATYGKYMNLKPYSQYIYRDSIFDGQSRVGQVGVLISMENNSLNLGGIITSIAGTVAAGFAGGAAAAIASSAGIIGAADSTLQTTASTSQSGSTALVWMPIVIDCYFWNSVGHDAANLGRAYCQTGQISAFSGYLKCNNSHIEGGLLSSAEIDMIESLMDSGFYYE